MKITKSQLRQIIKEELKYVLESQGDQFTFDPEMVARPSSIREPTSQDEKSDAENALRKATEFISSSPLPTFDGLVAHLAETEWYDESYAAEIIDQMIDNGSITSTPKQNMHVLSLGE